MEIKAGWEDVVQAGGCSGLSDLDFWIQQACPPVSGTIGSAQQPWTGSCFNKTDWKLSRAANFPFPPIPQSEKRVREGAKDVPAVKMSFPPGPREGWGTPPLGSKFKCEMPASSFWTSHTIRETGKTGSIKWPCLWRRTVSVATKRMAGKPGRGVQGWAEGVGGAQVFFFSTMYSRGKVNTELLPSMLISLEIMKFGLQLHLPPPPPPGEKINWRCQLKVREIGNTWQRKEDQLQFRISCRKWEM